MAVTEDTDVPACEASDDLARAELALAARRYTEAKSLKETPGRRR